MCILTPENVNKQNMVSSKCVNMNELQNIYKNMYLFVVRNCSYLYILYSIPLITTHTFSGVAVERKSLKIQT